VGRKRWAKPFDSLLFWTSYLFIRYLRYTNRPEVSCNSHDNLFKVRIQRLLTELIVVSS
jgi:hypothetical protein